MLFCISVLLACLQSLHIGMTDVLQQQQPLQFVDMQHPKPYDSKPTSTPHKF